MTLRLMRKDLLLSWTQVPWIAGAIALMFVLQAFNGDQPTPSMLFGSFMAGFVPVIISVREDRFRSNALSCSLPVTRRQIVLARYLVGPALFPVWVLCSVLLAWPLSHEGFPVAMLRLDALATGFAILVLTVAFVTPLFFRFGWAGFLYGLVGLQALGIIVLLAGPRLGLRGGLLAIEDALRSIGPGLRALRALAGDAVYFPAAFVALAVAFGLSCAASCALFRRRDL